MPWFSSPLKIIAPFSLSYGQENSKFPTSPTHKIVVEVAYNRWLFMGGSNYRALIRKMLVFWIGGHLEE